jgi:PIN domain nuclease of toxin-antitoxin system
MQKDNTAPVLLDTHVWIWLLEGDEKLAKSPALHVIQQAATSKRVLIPAISIWELSMLETKRRISLSMDLHSWVHQALAVPGYSIAPLSPDISIESCLLPGSFHGDPADRMIVATARSLHGSLITADRKILDYANTGHLQALRV